MATHFYSRGTDTVSKRWRRGAKGSLADKRRKRRLLLERLEDRRVLATWSSDINVNTTWSNDEVQYVTNDIAVVDGVTLTVEPGTIVQFDFSDSLTVHGTLSALGTPTSPILFTSDADDTGLDGIEGTADDVDTEGNGATTGSVGTWENVQFTSTSTGSVIQHAEFRFGGRGSMGTVFVNGGALNLTDSHVRNSSTAGVSISAATPTLSNLTIDNCRGAAIEADLGSDPAIQNVTLTDNSVNALSLESGVLPGDTNWNDPDVVYFLQDDVTVPSGATLTIDAGQIVKSEGHIFHEVDLHVEGTLVANGTADDPIIFTSRLDDSVGGQTTSSTSDPNAGDWGSINFADTSVSSSLDHVEIRYGGGKSSAGIIIASDDVIINNTTVSHSKHDGVRINDADPTLTDSIFMSNAQHAVSMDLTSSPVISGMTANDNSVDAVSVDGGELPASITWGNPDVVYWLPDSVTVPVGITLTVVPGKIIKADIDIFSSSGIDVYGKLLAQGTSTAPIVFTSERDDFAGGQTRDSDTEPDAGDWEGLNFLSGSIGNQLDYVDVRYAGRDQPGAIAVEDAELTFANSSVLESSHAGLRIVKADPNVKDSSFLSNAQAPISMDLASTPEINNVAFSDNSIHAVALDGGELATDMTWDNPDTTYWLSDTVVVPAGITLTIAPGMVIKGNVDIFRSHGIEISGTLNAVGTSQEPIFFTSENDDSIGGETKLSTSPPVHLGGWNGLKFLPGSVNNQMEHTEIRYGGRDQGGLVYVDEADLTLVDSVIHGSRTHGLRVENATPSISRTTFADNADAAIAMDLFSNPDIQDVSLLGNSTNGLRLDGGELPIDASWDDPVIQYYLPSSITVPEGRTLTVAAGQIVKSNVPLRSEVGIVINGTMIADGTPEMPVIFSNDNDHAAGGPINDTDSPPNHIGGWQGLHFTSTSTNNVFDHVEVRYAGNEVPAAIILDGVDFAISNSLVLDPNGHAVLARNSASVDLTSNLLSGDSSINTRNEIAGQSDDGVKVESDSTVTIINNTIDGFQRGVSVDGGSAVLANDLITFGTLNGISVEGDGTVDVSHTNVFNPAAKRENYVGIDDQTGINGNLSVDPKYFHAAAHQYHLRGRSPVIDSGTSTGAPTLDYYENSRFDNPSVPNRGAGDMPFIDLGAIERQQTSTSDIDLAVLDVRGPAAGNPDETVTVQWTVRNVGTGVAAGSWRDAVYLSVDPVWTPNDVFLGEVTIDEPVVPGAEYEGSVDVVLPNVFFFPGDYYFIVRSNWQQDVFEASALLNNTRASIDTISTRVPELELGVTTTGTLEASGDSKLFQVHVDEGQSLVVELTGGDGNVQELFVSRGDAPTRFSFDARGVSPNTAYQIAALAASDKSTYYVLVYGQDIKEASTFSVTASLAGFEISKIAPDRGSTGGEVTVNIVGASFQPGANARLTDALGRVIDAITTTYSSPGLISATFDLNEVAAGLADITVVNPNSETTALADAFNVAAEFEYRVAAELIVPGRVRVGRGFDGYVHYTNEGTNNIPAPLFKIYATGPLVDIGIEEETLSAEPIFVLGVNPFGSAGILPPGTSGEIAFRGYGHSEGDEDLVLEIDRVDDSEVDWEALRQSLQPEGVAPDDWNPMFAEIRKVMGETWREFHTTLSRASSLMPPLRGENFLLRDVFDLVQDWALASLNTSVSGRLVDEAGQPVGNARLVLYDNAQDIVRTTISLNDGTYLFPQVPAGNYELHCETHRIDSTASIVVGDQDANVDDLVAKSGSKLYGWVVDSVSGAPLRDVYISVGDGRGHISTTLTDSEGRYAVDVGVEGPYVVTGDIDGYVRAEREIDVAQGENHYNLALVLQKAGQIAGSVSGLPGSVSDESQAWAVGEDGTIRGIGSLNSDGSYIINGLSQAQYEVIFSIPGYTVPKVQNVAVRSGQKTDNTDTTAVAAGYITGTVQETDGTSVPKAVVYVMSGSEIVERIVANDQGSYTSFELTPGDYKLSVAPAGYISSTLTASVIAAESTIVNLNVVPAGLVRGTVSMPSGDPISNIRLIITDSAGNQLSSFTDSDGNYRFEDLSIGEYVVTVGSDGQLGQQKVTTESGTENQVDFQVNFIGRLVGTVFESDGATPIEHATIHLYQDGYELGVAYTDAEGKYEVRVLQPESYDLVATRADRSFTIVKGFAVTAQNEPQRQDFLAGNETFVGSVTQAANGNLLVEAAVQLEQKLADDKYVSIGETTLDEFGQFKFSQLAAGDYRVTVVPDAEDLAVTISNTSVAQSSKDGTGEGEASTPDIELSVEDGNEVEIVLVDAQNGTLIEGGHAFLIRAPLESGRKYPITKINGKLVSRSIPPGDYFVQVGEQSGYENVTTVKRAPYSVVANQRTVITIKLQRRDARMAGTVYGGFLEPLAGVAIELSGKDEPTVATISGKGGKFAFASGLLKTKTYTLTLTRQGFKPVKVSVTPSETVSINLGETLFDIIWKGIKAAYGWLADTPVRAVEWLMEKVAGVPDEIHPKKIPPAKPKCVERGLDKKASFAVDQAKNSYEAYEATYVKVHSGIGTLEKLGRIALIIHKWAFMFVPLAQFAQKAGDGWEALQKISDPKFKKAANAAIILLKTNEVYDKIKSTTELGVDAYSTFNTTKKVDPLKQAKFWNDMSAKTAELIANESAQKKLQSFVQEYEGLRKTMSNAADAAGFVGATLFPPIDAAVTTAMEMKEIADIGKDMAEANKRLPDLEKDYKETTEKAKQAIAALKACNAGSDDKTDKDPDGGNGDEKDRKKQKKQIPKDPNDKLGAASFGTSGFVKPGVMHYEVLFENDPDVGATIPAQEVFITDVLDEDLDIGTVEFTRFGFNNLEFDVPSGLSHYEATLDLRPEGIDLLVPVTLQVDVETRILSATFSSLDPATGMLPEDIDAGFLPVNDKALHNGEGFFRYHVSPIDGIANGTEIRNQASIVFELNEPILTPETVHTIDNGLPSSTISELDDAYGTANFMIEWSGQDDENGSGIDSYDLFVSRDKAPFEILATQLNETSYEFTGESGVTYGFASVARDNVGNLETMPTVSDTETLVIIGAWVNPKLRYDVDNNGTVTALDALTIINEMERRQVSHQKTSWLTPLPPNEYAPPYYDVNADGKATALDALDVINQLPLYAKSEEAEPETTIYNDDVLSSKLDLSDVDSDPFVETTDLLAKQRTTNLVAQDESIFQAGQLQQFESRRVSDGSTLHLPTALGEQEFVNSKSIVASLDAPAASSAGTLRLERSETEVAKKAESPQELDLILELLADDVSEVWEFAKSD